MSQKSAMDCKAAYAEACAGGCGCRHRKMSDSPPQNWYCREWVARGVCARGASCLYVHPSPPWLAVTDCPDFITHGYCGFETLSAGCPMRHNAELRVAVDARRYHVCEEWTNPAAPFNCRMGACAWVRGRWRGGGGRGGGGGGVV
jgi:hypothetical protein